MAVFTADVATIDVVKEPKKKSRAVAPASVYDVPTAMFTGLTPLMVIIGLVTSGDDFTVRVRVDTLPAASVAVTVYDEVNGYEVICVPEVIPVTVYGHGLVILSSTVNPGSV